MSEVATIENREIQKRSADGTAFLELISRAASDPTVDVAKMKELLSMRVEIMAREAEMAFSQAMARLQPRLPRITKHGRICVNGVVRNTYARIEDIDAVIRPLYSEEGFSISWNTSVDDKASGTRVLGKLRHECGHSESYSIFLPNDNSGGKNGIQGVGSTVSYGRRYLLCSMFNIITVDEDDDGSGDKLLTQAQINQIRDLIIEKKANESKFCELLDVQSVEEITQDRFKIAMNALRMKGQK